jgi:lysozyme family protein
MSLKNRVISKIITLEGGYVNDKEDSGGETKYGITKCIALFYGYKGSMRDLPKNRAFYIYRRRYWDSMRLDDIESIAGEVIVEELLDTAINMGVSRASEFLQRSLNALNNREKNYKDLIVDRNIGDATLSALKSFIRSRETKGCVVLSKMLNSLQGAFYITLAERREKDEKFIYGWFSNRVT